MSRLPVLPNRRRERLTRDLMTTTALAVLIGAAGTGAAFAQYAAGSGATATGTNATAVGPNATATGRGAVAVGSGATGNTATGNRQGVIDHRVTPNGTITPPNETDASGPIPSGTAIGEESTVGNGGGVAVGYRNSAGSGTFSSTAIGTNNNAAGNYSVGIGNANITANTSSVAIGTANQATGYSSLAFGRESYAYGDNSIAQGFVASAYGSDAIALGRFSIAGITNGTETANIAIGDNTSATGGRGLALGSGARSSALGGVALGSDSVALRGGLNGNEAFSGNGVASSLGAVSVGNGSNLRQITNLAGGTQDTDAVNLRQLRAVGSSLAGTLGGSYDAAGTYTAPSYSYGGATYDNLPATVSAIDRLGLRYDRDGSGNPTGSIDLTRGGTVGGGSNVAITGLRAGTLAAGSTDAVNGGQLYTTNQNVQANTTNLNALSTGIDNGTVGLVRQDAASRTIRVASATDGTLVDISGTQGARRLTGLANGIADADAATVGQLRLSGNALAQGLGGGAAYDPATGTLTAPSYAVGGRSYADVGSALAATNNLAVQYVPDANGAPTGVVDLGRGNGGNAVRMRNVAAGTLNATSTEAVNGSQLHATNQAVSDLSDSMNNGSVGLVRQDAASRGLTVGAATDGTIVNFSNNAGIGRVLTGLGDGQIAAGSRDAVNGGQIAAISASTAQALGGGAGVAADGRLTAPSYTVQGTTHRDVGSALAATDSAVTANAAGLTTLRNDVETGAVGLVRQDQASGALTLGANSAGTSLNLANNQGRSRTVSGVAAGALNANSTDAVNGSQLHATNQAVSNLSNAVNTGQVGLVRQDVASRGLTVGAETDGTTVSFANNAGAGRVLTGVGAGQIAAGSTQAVNGGQVRGALDSTAAALGGGATVGADGRISAPSYTVQGKTYNDVGSAIGNLDNAVTNLNTNGSRYVAVRSTGSAASATGTDSVAVGPGAQASSRGGVALGAGALADRGGMAGAKEAFSGHAVGSTAGAVSVGAKGAERQITNVAGGTQDTDAVNVRQLRSVRDDLATALGGGAATGTGGSFKAPSYSMNNRTYNSVGAALDAVDTFAVKYDVDPATGGRGQSLTLAGADPNEPVLIRNVADGKKATDAANVGQVQRAKAESFAYTDTQVKASYTASTSYTDKRVAPLETQMASFGNALASLQGEIGQVRQEARRGAAIGLAAASLRFDDRPGKLSMAAGGGMWRGEGAASMGIGYTLPDGSARMNATGVSAGRDFGFGFGASVTLN